MTEPLCYIPSPYGKPVAVFKVDGMPDGGFAHDFNGAMDFAGIHDPAQRDRCFKALNGDWKDRGGVSFQLFLDHGGRKVPKRAIIAPRQPATPEIPNDAKIREVSENWATLVLDYNNWTERAAALLDVIDGSTQSARSWTMAEADGFDFVHAFSMSILLTSAIEHLVEREIDCLEQAAFYALATHDEWSKAGVAWLKPFRKTWFRDWAADRPVWQELARAMRDVNRDLPSWIVKGAAS